VGLAFSLRRAVGPPVPRDVERGWRPEGPPQAKGLPHADRLRLPLVLCLCLALHATILDRVAVVVGDSIITGQQILDEIRIAAFLGGLKPDYGLDARRSAAERLIRQTLIRREMDASHYPLPDPSEADPLEQQIVAQYGGEKAYEAALARYGLTRDDVRSQLLWQLTTLRFIDFRFRPAVHVPNSAVEDYYDQQVAKWKAEGRKNIPSLENSRDRIEEILTAQRVDRALDAWLSDARKQVNISYHEGAFQ
jgi:hypothetical protein